MSELHVACAAETNYVAHSAALIHSLLDRHGGGGVHVHYLHGPEFPAHERGLLEEMVGRLDGAIDFHAIAHEQVAGLPSHSRFTSAMWYRTFLPDLLPTTERALYLDVDTIVADSLVPLLEIDLADNWVAAVTNVFQHNHFHRPHELGLAGRNSYFNSGVLLMNLDAMRRDSRGPAIRECAREAGAAFEWPDQDALNVVLGSRRLSLHPRWNVMNAVLHFAEAERVFGTAAVEEARRDPAIRHYEGPDENKPWDYRCPRAMRELYLRHRRGTPWPEVSLSGVTGRNAMRRLVRGPRRRQAVTEWRTGYAVSA